MMNMPSATFSSKIDFSDDQSSARVMREVDFGMQEVEVSLPAVFTVDLRLNNPRFANVQGILKAKKKPVEVIKIDDLGLDVAPRIKVEKVEPVHEDKHDIICRDGKCFDHDDVHHFDAAPYAPRPEFAPRADFGRAGYGRADFGRASYGRQGYSGRSYGNGYERSYGGASYGGASYGGAGYGRSAGYGRAEFKREEPRKLGGFGIFEEADDLAASYKNW